MSDGADEEPRNDVTAPVGEQPRTGGGPSRRTIGLIAGGAGALVLLIAGSVALGVVVGAALVGSPAAPAAEAVSATDAAGPTDAAPAAPPPEETSEPSNGQSQPAPAPAPQEPGLEPRSLVIQPTLLCQAANGYCPEPSYDTVAIAEVWSLAGIEVTFRPIARIYDDVHFLQPNCYAGYLDYMGAPADAAAPITMSIHDPCPPSSQPLARHSGNGFVVPGELQPDSLAIARMIGLNLGLAERDEPGALMSTTEPGTALSADDIARARTSALTTSG
ncbi:hypothetical protein [Agromyces mangrovi Wang et al. 2018]|uniref:hypothetical protein n=1 Tax=Agromyces mangrovi TaxID=1858653 RepID=UPI0025731680|nr:hypothetical protein [Agromyces mangrovi]BDZ63931.1 hypothetical protein GCM10025877_08690 [Agromyces mangrovi]